MSTAPRVVLVHRATELDELLARHATRGQAAFFLRSRGRSLDEVEERHERQRDAMATVSRAIPLDWRRGLVERADLSRFLFEPDDLIVVVGQDGLVANVSKYLQAQPVLGVNPDPARNPGILVPHSAAAAAELLDRGRPELVAAQAEQRTMVEAALDDGQTLIALNEIFVGPPSHQTGRYSLHLPDGREERQASSGMIVATGTGSTGWCRSVAEERRTVLTLPAPCDGRLVWFVREAWPSPATGTGLTEGEVVGDQCLDATVESDRLVVFGDGMEADALSVTWGQALQIRIAAQRLHLVRP